MTNPAGRTCALTATSVNGTAVAPGDFATFVRGQVSINQVPSVNLPISVVNDVAVTTAGGTAPIVVVCNKASGTFFALGTTTVTCTATDAEGEVIGTAVATGSFTVQVVDVEPPMMADLPDLTRVAPGLSAVIVTFPFPSATDNSGIPPTVVCSPDSGTSFSIGVATVTCTAKDGAGNQTSSSFTVTVTSDGLGLGLPATGSTPQPLLAIALGLLGVGLLLLTAAQLDLKRRRVAIVRQRRPTTDQRNPMAAVVSDCGRGELNQSA